MLVKELKNSEVALNFIKALGMEKFGEQPMHILNELKVINQDVYEYSVTDVLVIIKSCLMEGVSLLNKEAYIVTRNTNVGTKASPVWVKKPQLSIDYKYQYQQILNSELCESFKIIEVYDGDEVMFSNGEYSLVQQHRNVVKGKPNTVGYFGILKLTNGSVFTEYETIEDILLKANPETKKIYEGVNSKWMYSKFIIRQILKQVPSKYKFFQADLIEDSVNEIYIESNSLKTIVSEKPKNLELPEMGHTELKPEQKVEIALEGDKAEEPPIKKPKEVQKAISDNPQKSELF